MAKKNLTASSIFCGTLTIAGAGLISMIPVGSAIGGVLAGGVVTATSGALMATAFATLPFVATGAVALVCGYKLFKKWNDKKISIKH